MHPDFVFNRKQHRLNRAFCFRYRTVIDHESWYADVRRWKLVRWSECITSLEWN